MAFLSCKIPSHKIPKFPNNSQATRMFLVGTWARKYKGCSLQILPTTFLRYKISNKIPKFPNNFLGHQNISSWNLDTQIQRTQFAIFPTPSVLPQYFPNAVKKFPNQMLRNIPRTDFNAEFARYNALERSKSYI